MPLLIGIRRCEERTDVLHWNPKMGMALVVMGIAVGMVKPVEMKVSDRFKFRAREKGDTNVLKQGFESLSFHQRLCFPARCYTLQGHFTFSIHE